MEIDLKKTPLSEIDLSNVVLPHNAPCNGCLNESRTECTHINWQPKESVSIGGGWFVEDSSKKKNTISESINKRVKELQNDSMIDYVSMNHIAQHGVNDSLKEVYCFIKAIIEYLEVTNANK